jgi:hypothetical protein
MQIEPRIYLTPESAPDRNRLTLASVVLARAGVRLMELETGFTIGIWSDLDSADLRAAIGNFHPDGPPPIRYLDGPGIPPRFKLRRVAGRTCPDWGRDEIGGDHPLPGEPFSPEPEPGRIGSADELVVRLAGSASRTPSEAPSACRSLAGSLRPTSEERWVRETADKAFAEHRKLQAAKV